MVSSVILVYSNSLRVTTMTCNSKIHNITYITQYVGTVCTLCRVIIKPWFAHNNITLNVYMHVYVHIYIHACICTYV